MTITRVEVSPKQGEGMRDVRGDMVQRQLAADHNLIISNVRSAVGYLISSSISGEHISQRIDDIFTDPIIEQGYCNSPAFSDELLFAEPPELVITVGFKPGVTDNPGKAAQDGFQTLFPEATDRRFQRIFRMHSMAYLLKQMPTTSLQACITTSSKKQ